MGRPMGGGGSGGRSSGGGGFRPSSSGSSRSGSGSRPTGSSYRSRPPREPRPPRYGRRYGSPPPPPGGYGGGYYSGPPRRSGCVSNIVGTVVAVIIVVFAVVSVISRDFLSCVTCGKCGNDRNYDRDNGGYNEPAEPGNNSVQNVTVKKNSPSAAFTADCVVDETGWFENPKSLGRNLEFVYEKLGIQPYVVFVKYNSSYTTDQKRQEYCDKWYDDHIKNEDTFLVMYFSEKDDDEVGLFKFCIGSKAKTVGDKITGIFENGINEFWFDESLSLDEVISSAFRYTTNHVTVK